MKFSEENSIRHEPHRKRVERVVSSIVTGNPLNPSETNPASVKKLDPAIEVARSLFAIPKYTLTEDEITPTRNLIKYIAKHHVHTVSQTLDEETYEHYMREGWVSIQGEGGDVTIQELEFTVKHELSHYLISWLLNNNEGVNNSATPTYIEEMKVPHNALDQDGVRRDFLEEVYAQVIDYNSEEYMEHTFSSQLKESLEVAKTFEDTLMHQVGIWLDYEKDITSKYETSIVDPMKSLQDHETCKQRMLDVITATEEERLHLRAKYPVECFVYDLGYATYFNAKKDSRAVWNVYQKHFARLFEKANANPDIYGLKKNK